MTATAVATVHGLTSSSLDLLRAPPVTARTILAQEEGDSENVVIFGGSCVEFIDRFRVRPCMAMMPENWTDTKPMIPRKFSIWR
jgi:hypothetical protein